MRRTSARLAQLRAHLYRCKWRDKQAKEAYWTLVLAQKPGRNSINLKAFDDVMRSYYTDAHIRAFAVELNPALRFLGKKLSRTVFRVQPVDECPPDRLYSVAEFIPQEEPVARIIDDEPPIKTGVASDAYKDGWERTFGEKKDECTCPHQDANEPDHERACAFYRRRIANCPSSECEIRNRCTGHLNCPRTRGKETRQPPADAKLTEIPHEPATIVRNTDGDAIEMRLKLWGYKCNTCDKIVYDPENHQHHAIIKIGDE